MSLSSTSVAASSTAVATLSAAVSPSQSPSVIPSPTPACVGTPVSNYLANPQFDTVNYELTGWSTTQTSFLWGKTGGHPGYYFGVVANGFIEEYKVPSDPILQTVAIPAGTVVRCSAWTKIVHGDGTPKVFELRIDGVLCAQRTDTAVGDWKKLTGLPIVLSGDTHTVSLQMMQVSTPLLKLEI
jgi:hypothetical protein